MTKHGWSDLSFILKWWHTGNILVQQSKSDHVHEWMACIYKLLTIKRSWTMNLMYQNCLLQYAHFTAQRIVTASSTKSLSKTNQETSEDFLISITLIFSHSNFTRTLSFMQFNKRSSIPWQICNRVALYSQLNLKFKVHPINHRRA